MPYTGVFVFGDSLVDAGNALKLAQLYGTLTFGDLPEGAPSAADGYFRGRFSNGYEFDDLISNKVVGAVTKPVFPYGYEDPWLGIPIDPFASDPSGHNLNFAYGGSQIRQGHEVVPDLDGQTDAFKDAVDQHADSNALYIVTIGGNDVRSLAPSGSDPVSQATAYAALNRAADTMLGELKGLINVGVHNLLITGLPDVGLIPRYDVNGNLVLDGAEIARSAAATDYSKYLDNLIRTKVLPALQAAGANVTYVPLMDYTDASGAHVGTLSAILPTIASLNGLTTQEISQALLEHQDLVFFDQVHPTAQTHALVAAYANAQLTGQPWIERTPLLGADVDYRTVGSIGVAGEVDKLLVATVPNTTYTFQMLGVSSITSYVLGQVGVASFGSSPALGDTSLKLLNAAGATVATDDDSGIGLDANLAFTSTATGVYTLSLSAVGSLTGQYVLTAAVDGAAMAAGNAYSISNSSTLVLEGIGGIGQDTVLSAVSYSLAQGSEIEVLRTTNDKGKGSLNLTGNEFAQTIIGNAGANMLEGKGGADTFYGGNGSDRFVLSKDALTNPASVDRIMDYSSTDTVDLTQVLQLGSGIDPIAGGYLRVTSGGLVQVDLTGGGDAWATLSTINGSGSVTVRYISAGVTTNVSAARTGDALTIMKSALTFDSADFSLAQSQASPGDHVFMEEAHITVSNLLFHPHDIFALA